MGDADSGSVVPVHSPAAWRPISTIVRHLEVDTTDRALTEPLREDIRLLGGMLGDAIPRTLWNHRLNLVEGRARRRSTSVRINFRPRRVGGEVRT